jgi:DNA polymerase I-like protein with 3'-5' exonuclease and polymerase domains/5'-3' exonuclease
VKKLLIVDGNSLINRAYYAFGGRGEVGELSFGGMPTNAVYGFLNMFIKCATEIKADYTVVAFDMRAKTFRHKISLDYKATRHKMPDDLAVQIDALKHILAVMKVKMYGVEGYEADDILGTITKKTDADTQCIILSADRDGLQLVNGNTELHLTKTGVTNLDIWDEERIINEYGIMPKQLIDVKALMGDKSDNILGCPGIGEKTALALVKEFGDVDGVLKKSANAKIAAGRDSIILSRSLAEINCAVPLEFKLDGAKFIFPFDRAVFAEFEKQGFKSLLKRKGWWSFNTDNAAESPTKEPQIVVNDEYEKIDNDLLPILSKMSEDGVKVDLDALKTMEVKIQGEIDALTREIYALAGEEFNINSPKVLGEILTKTYGVALTKKTKTGVSTDEEVLLKLIDEFPLFPLASKVLEYRGKYKLYSTYIRGYGSAVDLTGFIHTTFNIDKTATGRLSSSEPNLQNIPVRTTGSDEFRKIFVSRFTGGKILSADYSQIELRLLAHLSNDKNLIDAFTSGRDIHTETARKVFGVDAVTPNLRRKAKAVNFGIIYGISAFGLGRDIGASVTEAAGIINNYFATFARVKEYLDECIEFAKSNGFVATMFGRRRYIKELYSNNNNVVAFATRAAMNMPMQGSSADIIKKAMVEIDREFAAKKLQSKMVLQIHDELVFDCVADEVEAVQKIIKDKMETVVQLKVPLTVDVMVGDSL